MDDVQMPDSGLREVLQKVQKFLKMFPTKTVQCLLFCFLFTGK